MSDGVYRLSLAYDGFDIREMTIEPSPYGDPYTVKITVPYPEPAWAILPRDIFSDEVNRITGGRKIWRVPDKEEEA